MRRGALTKKLRERFGDQAFDGLGYIKEEFVEKLYEEAIKSRDVETIKQAVFYFNFVVKRRKKNLQTENEKLSSCDKKEYHKREIKEIIKI